MSDKAERVRRVFELVGLFGVVASLIFVGLEVRQSAAATRAATAQEVTSAFRDLNLAMATDAELSGLITKYRTNPEEASEVEKTQLMAFNRALFHIWSNAYYQNLNGTIDPQIYEGMVSEVSTYARAGIRSIFWAWESQSFIYPEAFRAFMDSIAATAPDQPNDALMDSIVR